MKLFDEEDKNTRKCQKESKNGEIQQSIVATMTLIVPRWDYLVPKEAEPNLHNF
jgi:hypothetical protein